jgi:hypothetical protein
MRPYLLLTSVLMSAALVGLTGCGDDSGGGAQGGTEPTTESTATEDQTEDQTEAPDGASEEAPREDVKITACGGDAGLTATLEVTNSFDHPIEYYGTILFKDASGTTLTEGLYNTGTLEPGATGAEEIPGANVYEPVPGVTCELGDAKLDEPE